jgi:hypothetical protein
MTPRVSVQYVKRNWGSGRRTWRPTARLIKRSDLIKLRNLPPDNEQYAVRRVSNKLGKKIWNNSHH